MLSTIIVTEHGRARHLGTLFGPFLDDYLTGLSRNGFTAESLRCKLRGVARFGEFLADHGVDSVADITDHDLERFHEHERACLESRYFLATRKGVASMLAHLRDRDLISRHDEAAIPARPVDDYYRALDAEQGLAEASIARRRYDVEQFLRFLGSDGTCQSLSKLTQEDIDAYFVHAGQKHVRTGMPAVCSSLRQFLRYLYRAEIVPTDFSQSLLRTKSYSLERIPCALPWPTVKRVLDVQDPSTPAGIRNLAVLWLLITYGLRPGEVAKLRLEDVCWRNEVIVFRRSKSGRPLHRPLMPEAGEALLAYLRRERPTTELREVFINLRAPLAPMRNSAVCRLVQQSLEKAGIESSKRGAYLIRHSYAMHLLRQGESLKTISDMLGHRDPNVVYKYTKLAVEDLRDVALPATDVLPNRPCDRGSSRYFQYGQVTVEDLRNLALSATEVLP